MSYCFLAKVIEQCRIVQVTVDPFCQISIESFKTHGLDQLIKCHGPFIDFKIFRSIGIEQWWFLVGLVIFVLAILFQLFLIS